MALNDAQQAKLDADNAQLDKIERQLRTIDGRFPTQLERILDALTAIDENHYADLISILGRISDGE